MPDLVLLFKGSYKSFEANTRSTLKKGNLHLHKISSNSSEELSAFNKEDLVKDLHDIDLDNNNPSLQRSVRVFGNLCIDSFTFHVSLNEKPFTRRGVLDVVNGQYDPLGLTMPVTIGEKLLLLEAMVEPWNGINHFQVTSKPNLFLGERH